MKVLSVIDSVADHLQQEIILGILPAGAKLNEPGLAGRLGVSRQPLREAFRKLEQENLVTMIPRRGVYVTSISVDDCEKTYSARHFIENNAILFFEKQGIKDFPLVKNALTRARQFTSHTTPDSTTILEHYQVMAEFHLNLVEYCQNTWLSRFYRELHGNLARYQVMYLNLPGSLQSSLEEHAEILELIEAEDYLRARNCLEMHIGKTVRQIKINIETKENSSNFN